MPALRRNYHKKEQKRGEKKKMQKAKEQKENNKKTTNQRRNVRKGFMFAQGITIIALVITIIILLILAGIVLNLALGNNGLFSMAKSAVEKYKISANEESELFEELDKNFIVGNNKLPGILLDVNK